MNFLQNYQQQLGLTPDGIVGPKTMKAMLDDMEWDDPKAFVHGIGQAKLESGGFTFFRESLNYKPEDILRVFNTRKKKRFTVTEANQYGRTTQHAANQQMIGNIAYENRGGNGPRQSGDGFYFRGGLGIQVTFRDGWMKFFEFCGLPPNTNPDSLIDKPKLYFMSVKFYFVVNNVGKICTNVNSSTCLSVSRFVNVGRANTSVMPHDWAKRELFTKEIALSTGVFNGSP